MAIGERIGTMIVLEEERPAVISEPTGFVWRVEYTILLGVMALLTAFAIAFFYFSANIESLKSYGYAGLFLINIIGAASILLPSPAGGDGRGRGRAAGGRPGRAGVRLGGTGPVREVPVGRTARGSWRGRRPGLGVTWNPLEGYRLEPSASWLAGGWRVSTRKVLLARITVESSCHERECRRGHRRRWQRHANGGR